MIDKKRIAFYPILANGHFNFCASIAQALLNNFPNAVEIYFIVDDPFADKLRKIDNRFKYGIIKYLENKELETRITDLIYEYEKFLYSESLVESVSKILSKYMEDEVSMAYIDNEARKQIETIKPDFLLCDQIYHLPSMQSAKNYGFVCSCNPLTLGFENYPPIGSDASLHETDKIKQFVKDFEPAKKYLIGQLKKVFKINNVPIPKDESIFQPVSKKHFSIYSYPSELDYYSEDFKKEHNLFQVDSPLIAQRISSPFQLPSHWKELKEKIIYLSLGSLFSAYYSKLQKLIDILDKLPYKFIVSKGPNGDKLKFPNNKFIGDNYVDQLAILQVVDLAITHGGNNSFCECIQFGVKQIIFPIHYDQHNNAKRVVETGCGYSLDLIKYTEGQLLSTVEAALKNDKMTSKLNQIKQRIEKDDKLNKIAARIMDHIEKL